MQIVGLNQAADYEVAVKLANQIRHIPGAVDVHVQQAFDSPTLYMDIDRTRAQYIGLQARDIANNVLVSLSSSFQTAPNFWLDPKNGVSYNVAVQAPQYRIDSLQTLENTPVTGATGTTTPQILGNLVTTSTVARPATISHYNVQPMINVYASVNESDLGSVSDEVIRLSSAIQKELPRGSRLVLRGQVQTMKSSFLGLGVGLVGAIILAYLLIVVNFQSLARSVHHHYGTTGGAGRNRVDAARYAYHLKCSFLDGRDHVHGRGHGQQYFDGFLRP